MRGVFRGLSALLSVFVLLSAGWACAPDPYTDPIPFGEGCKILNDAAQAHCGPELFLDCLAIVPCEACCSDWSKAQTEACAEKIRAAKSCVEVGWVECDVECRIWVE